MFSKGFILLEVILGTLILSISVTAFLFAYKSYIYHRERITKADWLGYLNVYASLYESDNLESENLLKHFDCELVGIKTYSKKVTFRNTVNPIEVALLEVKVKCKDEVETFFFLKKVNESNHDIGKLRSPLF